MPSFTLIIPTFGRTKELDELFASLASQRSAIFDCIVVDQNDDERLQPILSHWSPQIAIRSMRASPGVSQARNFGLLHATGDIIAFPDDDCWYTAGLLANIATWFEEHPDCGLLAVGAQDKHGTASGNRWIQQSCDIHPLNIFRTTFCSSLFLRRSVAGNARFDEAIGPGAGSAWFCGEETDYVLNLRDRGVKGFFDRRWHVGHPKRDMLSGTIDAGRASGYGRGMGHVLQKHSLFLLATAFFLYDIVRILAVILRGDWKSASLCLHHAAGIFTGYTGLPSPPAVLAQ